MTDAAVDHPDGRGGCSQICFLAVFGPFVVSPLARGANRSLYVCLCGFNSARGPVVEFLGCLPCLQFLHNECMCGR